MFVKSAAAVALLASVVTAQTNLTFDPSSIEPTIRGQWCQAEFNTCKILCGTYYNENSCNQTTLAYECTCSSNNSAPGLQYYQQTMPTFICEQNFKLCNLDALNQTDSASAQAACEATEKADCGHLDPTNFTAATTSSSSATASSTPTGTGSAAAGNSATSSSSKAAAATMAAMRNFGTGAFAVGAGVVFGALL